jgi:uncharacterized protein (TIGR02145 family)
MKTTKLDLLIMILASMFYSCDSAAPKEVKIGNQYWSTANLNNDKFRNGDQIMQVRTPEEWSAAGRMNQPAWCYYNYDPTNGDKYGKLYNWYAVTDSRGLAPEGWHIPSSEEWSVLIKQLGGKRDAGFRLKSTEGWWEHGNGNNESGFSAIPGGGLLCCGDFNSLDKRAYWWTTSEYSEGVGYGIEVSYHKSNASGYDGVKSACMSVRCVKD